MLEKQVQFGDIKLYRKELPFHLSTAALAEGIFEGYGAVMGNVDAYGEVIDPGAFKRTLKKQGERVKICWQHDWFEPIGKPMEIREVSQAKLPQEIQAAYPEATGALYVKAKVSPTARGKDAIVLMADGVLNELSIGFDLLDSGVETDEKGVRHLTDIELYEISLVTMAANPAAQVVSFKAEPLPVHEKPYPNEHACRLRAPGDFEEGSFRRTTRKHEGKEYSVIMGKLTGEDTMTEQAYRYPKNTWEAGEAKAHCEAHDGSFEPAAEEAAPAPEESTHGPSHEEILALRIRIREAELELTQGGL
jgi:HK97 family phage prohead protease